MDPVPVFVFLPPLYQNMLRLKATFAPLPSFHDPPSRTVYRDVTWDVHHLSVMASKTSTRASFPSFRGRPFADLPALTFLRAEGFFLLIGK